jgi:hypothetical protein
MLREIDEIMALRPALGSLIAEVNDLKAMLAGQSNRSTSDYPALTTAGCYPCCAHT